MAEDIKDFRKLTPMEAITYLMETINEIGKKNKIKMNVDATFTKSNETNTFNWKI